MTGADWGLLARLALGALGWEPDAFWRATPGELALALAGRFSGQFLASPATEPLSRSELSGLIRRFPDH